MCWTNAVPYADLLPLLIAATAGITEHAVVQPLTCSAACGCLTRCRRSTVASAAAGRLLPASADARRSCLPAAARWNNLNRLASPSKTTSEACKAVQHGATLLQPNCTGRL